MISATKIKDALKQPLPGENSHVKMLPVNRRLSAFEEELSSIKHSSVLLLLYIENDDLKVLLIKRPAHMKHHAGQVALPGGRIEKNETAVETALRETQEEVGISPGDIEILGKLSELYVQVSFFQIHPFVGWLRKHNNFNINKSEVEKIIAFPLKNMSNETEEIELNSFSGPLKVPCIKFNDEIIWGATAMILMEFFDLIKPFTEK